MRIARSVSVTVSLLLLHLSIPHLSSAAAVPELYGTFHAMGVIINLTSGEDPNQNAVATLSYRPAGSGEYRQGFPLSRVAADRFVGSIFWLSPGTSYDVRVTFSDPDGPPLGGAIVNGTAATRPETVIPAASKSYYASTTGSGTACSPASPCPLSTALGQAQPGQEVVLRAGVYYQGELSLPRSGTAAAPIVVRGYQGETAALDGADPAAFNWDNQGSGVYRASVNYGTHLVMADGKRLYPYQSLADLQNLIWDMPGFFADGTYIYVRLAGDAKPDPAAMLVSRFNYAITIGQSFIVIKDLTFRHYGAGDFAKALYLNNASDNLVQGCTFAVNDLGIGIKRESHRNVIQDNTFYDTDFDWPWDAVKSGSDLETGGIRLYNPMTGRGTVIRRNSFHDYFDGFGACPDATAGITNETDVYENLVYNAGDDGMETDGQCSNVRIWGNTFHDVLDGISLAPVYTGPVYAIRNLVYRTGAGNNDYPGSPFKFNSGYDPSGPIFLFHNTADAVLADSSGLDIKSPGSWKMISSRNNIWSGTDFALSNANPVEPLNLDYDGLYTTQPGEFVWWDGLSDRHIHTIEALRSATGQELHGINAAPDFAGPADGNYLLSATSAMIDKGVYIAGINDGFAGSAPDMGAFEFLPTAPVNGECGLANGQSFDTAPAGGLCNAGTASAVSGAGPWSWSCTGANGGSDAQCSAGINHYTLTIHKTGSGNGTVTPDSGALAWVGATGSGTWLYNTQMLLTASPDSLSTFTSWSGDCVPVGVTCRATVSTDGNVAASFAVAPMAMIGETGYNTLGEAYDAAAPSGTTTIKTLDTDLGESLVMDKGKAIVLSGGYNAAYTARTGIQTMVRGLTLATGSLNLDGLAIR